MSRDELRWLAGASAFALLAFNLPYLIGAIRGSSATPFTGIVYGVSDLFSYYAKMRVGAGGGWLYQNMYAVEPHPASPIYIFYILLGKTTALITGQGSRVSITAIAWAYHLARQVANTALLVTIYQLLCAFHNDVRQRRFAWVLLVFGGGVGWLAVAITGNPVVLGGPLDLYLGEASNAIAMLALPHVALGRACLLGGLLAVIRAEEAGRTLSFAALWWLLAALLVPFHPVVAGGILAGWGILRWVETRHFPVSLARSGAFALLPGVVWMALMLISTTGSPVYESWQVQNHLKLTGLLPLLVGYGVSLVLGIGGAWLALRHGRARRALLLGWTISALVLPWMPISVSLRLIEGLFFPLVVLAMDAVEWLSRPWQPRWQKAARVGWLALVVPSPLLLVIGSTALALYGADPAYLSSDEAAAFEWLRHTAADGVVVLSAAESGERLPAAAPVRALIGHGFETPYFEGKRSEIERFFGAGMGDQERLDLLARYGVDLVYLGSRERALRSDEQAGTPFDASALGLVPVYDWGEVVIYRAGQHG